MSEPADLDFFDDNDDGDESNLLNDVQAFNSVFAAMPEPEKDQVNVNVGGRPRKNPNEAMTIVRKFRMTKTDADFLSTLAAKADMSEADYIRWALFHSHDNKKRKIPNAKEIQMLRTAFKRPSDLLNQALRLAHSLEGQLTPQQIEFVFNAIRLVKDKQDEFGDEIMRVLRDY